VYHCWCVDTSAPCRPTLEVEAILREAPEHAHESPRTMILPLSVLAGGAMLAVFLGWPTAFGGSFRIEQIIRGHKPLIVLKRVFQFVFIIDGHRLTDSIFANQVAHGFHVCICLVARHVNANHAQSLVLLFVTPLPNTRQVVFADPTARRPEVNERRMAYGL
jgi:NADH:ubiquinone oxidoreductase subunit 5 (subunit L)/multisubunit Na+/H+ antiporter MnhA subunit